MGNEKVLESPASTGAQPSRLVLTLRQRRVLAILADGDLIWEVAKSTRWTLFNPKTAKNLVLTSLEVKEMDAAGWIQRKKNPDGQWLDSWEISLVGSKTLQAS